MVSSIWVWGGSLCECQASLLRQDPGTRGAVGAPDGPGATVLPVVETRLAAGACGRGGGGVGTRCGVRSPWAPSGTSCTCSLGRKWGTGRVHRPSPPLPPPAEWFELGCDQLTWDGKLLYLGRSHPLSLHDVLTLRCASWSREHAELSRGNGVNVSRGRGRQVPSAPSSCTPAGRWWGASAWGWGSVPAGTPLCLASVSLSSAPPAAVDAGMILADSRGLCRRKRPRSWSRRAVFSGSVAEEDVGGAHFLLSPRQPGPAGVLRATWPQGPWGGTPVHGVLWDHPPITLPDSVVPVKTASRYGRPGTNYSTDCVGNLAACTVAIQIKQLTLMSL